MFYETNFKAYSLFNFFSIFNCQQDDNDANVVNNKNEAIFKRLLQTAKNKKEAYNRYEKTKHKNGVNYRAIDDAFEAEYGIPKFNQTIQFTNGEGKPILVIPLTDEQNTLKNILIGFEEDQIETYRVIDKNLGESSGFKVNELEPCYDSRLGTKNIEGLIKTSKDILSSNESRIIDINLNGLPDGCYELVLNCDECPLGWGLIEVECPNTDHSQSIDDVEDGSSGGVTDNGDTGVNGGGDTGTGTDNDNTVGGGNTTGGDTTEPNDTTTGTVDPCGADPFGYDLIDDIEELTSDCNVLKNLSNSPSFTQRMEELIANNTGNTEIGYWGRNDANNNMNYDDDDRFESEPNAMEITPPYPNDSIDSFIHNHFNNGTGTLPVFSGGDLYTIFNLYNAGLINDLDNFVMVVTTPGNNINTTDDDTVYAITISDTEDFINLSNVLSVTPDLIDNYYNNPNNLIHSNISTQLNEERLARLFKDRKFGMSLYRGNKNDLSNWTRLKIKDNGNFKENSCN